MNFYIRLRVSCEKSGLALLDMYDKLGFHESDRPNHFETKELDIEVTQEEALKHKDLFANDCEITINIDLYSTCPNDWVHFSNLKMGLNDENMTAERAISQHRKLIERNREIEENQRIENAMQENQIIKNVAEKKLKDLKELKDLNELCGFRI